MMICIFSLWGNTPKELIEYPDYTFHDHFGCYLPSYLPRAMILDYIVGRAKANNLRQFIRFNTVVRHVDFIDEKNEFSVEVEDFNKSSLENFTFDRVIVATGRFHVPHMIHIDGVDQFPGRVFHSHDLRDAEEFKGQHVLLIGGSVSADDIALQCVKFGARLVTMSARRQPVEIKWPNEVQLVPIIVRIEGRTAHLNDGSQVDNIDAIIFCTGYRHSYPFMSRRFRLQCGTHQLILPNLYKSLFWNDQPNLIYLGLTKYIYTFYIFEIQARIVHDVILGRIQLPNQNERQTNLNEWLIRDEPTLSSDIFAVIQLQNDYIRDILELLYTNHENRSLSLAKFNFDQCNILLGQAFREKTIDNARYRDASYESVIDSEEKRIVKNKKSWMENIDDSIL